MIHTEDIKVEGSPYLDSFSKLMEKPIVDVYGYIVDTGYQTYVFQISCIVFEDGTQMDVEGEHDLPYVTDTFPEGQPNYDEETLARLYKEGNEA